MTHLPRRIRGLAVTALTALTAAGLLLAPTTAQAAPGHDAGRDGRGDAVAARTVQQALTQQLGGRLDRFLTPRTLFEMKPDGSSGSRPDGAGIPNIDSVKSTIRTYYHASSAGIADKTSSPYITEMTALLARTERQLPALYRAAKATGRTPAIVFDADDTMLWTYDMEDGAMHFTFDPALQDVYVQQQRFPATPGMVSFVAAARRAGFAVFGLTGRNDDQKAATLGNLAKVGYTGFDSTNFFTRWTGVGSSQQPSYISCAAAKCTTVEYKAGTRAHLEQLGYDIALNVGDQFSDLQGGSAQHTLKLPNPTYYLPSPDLPGMSEPQLAPRTRFRMAPDGSSGLTQGGEGIPNVDSVKATIRTYYAASSAGTADTTSSPYITEMTRLTRELTPALTASCRIGQRLGIRPALVLDADDTSLWTYDMEDGAMHFTFDPALQDVYVQQQRFPATPGMVSLANAASAAGCTIVGITGRNDTQRAATLANLAKVGFTGYTDANYYTKWTGVGTSQQPSYISCAAARCTTVEYKSQTRAHVESAAGGRYTVLANMGDQFSDLLGGHALVPVKLPNPTYYLP